MELVEIVLLVAGALLFIGSFIVPVKKEELQAETVKLAEDEVKKLVAKEVEDIKLKLSGLSEEACLSQVDKAERTMERISNEKIMAVNEYSDTVLQEIHKNHQEVVFLYDMLNEKQDALKATISEADKNVKELLQQVKDSEITMKEQASMIVQSKEKQPNVPSKTEKQVEPIADEETPVMQEELSADMQPEFQPFQPQKVAVVPKKTRKKAQPKEKLAKERKDVGEMQLQFSAPKKENGINSNERILALHKAGKSNMAIARELGLGIGEVKLVIDLYEGMH